MPARAVREIGCTALLLKDEEGKTNERTKPAMQAMEMMETVGSFISAAVGCWLSMRKSGCQTRGLRRMLWNHVAIPSFGSIFSFQAMPLAFGACTPPRLATHGAA